MVMSIFIAASERAMCIQKTEREKPSQRRRLLPSRLGALQGSRNTRVFEDQRALSLVLEEKDSLLAIRAFWICFPLDEKCSLLVVEPSVAVDGLRQPHAYPLAAGDLCEGVDHLLRERLEEDCAGT